MENCYEQEGMKLCDIPNSLLENDGILTAYAYCNGEYTKQTYRFNVLERKKPNDYVEEEDAPKWSDLEKRIQTIEENTEEIILEQTRSGVDLFLGSGRSIYSDYRLKFNEKGYYYYNDYKEIDINNNKILGVFDEIGDEKTTNTIPSLDVLTNIAVNFMEKNFPDGYFLVVECGHIDKMSHNVNIFEMMEYLENFDKAVHDTYDILKSDEKAAIIVTANHETGGLRYNGELKDDINSMDLITYDGHTLVDVPYYIYFSNDLISSYFLPEIIDNTDIYKICKALLSD